MCALLPVCARAARYADKCMALHAAAARSIRAAKVSWVCVQHMLAQQCALPFEMTPAAVTVDVGAWCGVFCARVDSRTDDWQSCRVVESVTKSDVVCGVQRTIPVNHQLSCLQISLA